MTTRSRRCAGVLLVALMLGAGTVLADGAPGPDVGERIPAFRLPDQNGKAHTFADLTGPDGLLLLFYRTADW